MGLMTDYGAVLLTRAQVDAWRAEVGIPLPKARRFPDSPKSPAQKFPPKISEVL